MQGDGAVGTTAVIAVGKAKAPAVVDLRHWLLIPGAAVGSVKVRLAALLPALMVVVCTAVAVIED